MFRLFPIFLLAISSLSFFVEAVIPQKVLVCGVCRNVATPFLYTSQIMEQIGSLFEDYRIIVYENNSTDGTAHLLKKWQKQNPKVVLKSENISPSELAKLVINYEKDGTFFRPELIARARNIVLDIAMSDEYKDFAYLIWMDMDFRIPPKFEGIIEVFESSREWDAVFAYGIDPPGTYWDWYAFRDATYPIGSELLGNHWWYMPKSFHRNRSDDWHPVYSAFGGCGIYKKSSIAGCRYSAIPTQDLAKVAYKIISEGKASDHSQILTYLEKNKQLDAKVVINQPAINLPQIHDPNIGILLPDIDPYSLIWRMNFFVYQYPSVCEHVTFHASMIAQGHGKLFINPRLVFTYGG